MLGVQQWTVTEAGMAGEEGNLEPQQDVGGRRVSGQGGSYWVAVHERKVVDQAQGWLEQLEG